MHNNTKNQTVETFDVDAFQKLYQAESGSFWFRSRNRLLLWACRMFFHEAEKFMEIGCGTGFVLSAFRKTFPRMQITGTELFKEGLKYAKLRLGKEKNLQLRQLDATELAEKEKFDLIGAFDVLEHIPDDVKVIRNILNALKPGGGFLLTVPQHMWLWSHTDVNAKHQRRYSSGELHKKLVAAGFKIIFSSSFVTFLLPIMAISRLIPTKPDQNSELALPKHIDAFFSLIMCLEIAAIRAGLRFPAGGSLLVACVKEK